MESEPKPLFIFLGPNQKGADNDAVVEELQHRLPDADVSTAGLQLANTNVLDLRTGLGMSFGSSTLLGLSVGLVMVAQSLYALVLDHLESYGALKAIGATDRQIARILIGQGLTIGLIGCVVGHLVSWLLWAAHLFTSIADRDHAVTSRDFNKLVKC